jgi:hypothetical protein
VSGSGEEQHTRALDDDCVNRGMEDVVQVTSF